MRLARVNHHPRYNGLDVEFVFKAEEGEQSFELGFYTGEEVEQMGSDIIDAGKKLLTRRNLET